MSTEEKVNEAIGDGGKAENEQAGGPSPMGGPGGDSAGGGQGSKVEPQLIRFRQPKKRESLVRRDDTGVRPVTPVTSQAQRESQIRMLELLKESKAKAFFERQVALQYQKKKQ